MNLWIRSQDKEILMIVNTILLAEDEIGTIIGIGIDGKIKLSLGKYKTKERALEVLEEILQIIKKSNKNIFKINRIVDFNTLERIKNCYEEINNEEISLYDNHFELLNKKVDIEIYEMPLE